jgi:hypothetical protein
VTSLRFYWIWLKLGRAYWKSRHLWTLMAYLDSVAAATTSPRSVGDEMAAWLAAQEDEDAA